MSTFYHGKSTESPSVTTATRSRDWEDEASESCVVVHRSTAASLVAQPAFRSFEPTSEVGKVPKSRSPSSAKDPKFTAGMLCSTRVARDSFRLPCSHKACKAARQLRVQGVGAGARLRAGNFKTVRAIDLACSMQGPARASGHPFTDIHCSEQGLLQMQGHEEV